MSIKKRVERELQIYQEIPPAIMSEDPAAWWWNQRKTYHLLSDLAFSYLCLQASSTPSERVFSTAGDTICPKRSRILPEKADMIIFLNKNCFWFYTVPAANLGWVVQVVPCLFDILHQVSPSVAMFPSKSDSNQWEMRIKRKIRIVCFHQKYELWWKLLTRTSFLTLASFPQVGMATNL